MFLYFLRKKIKWVIKTLFSLLKILISLPHPGDIKFEVNLVTVRAIYATQVSTWTSLVTDERAWPHFYQTRSAWSMDQGSTKKRSAVHNFVPTVTKFCVMWEGLSLPHETKFGNCRGETVDRRVIFIWSLIHGSSWSGLIKVGPGTQAQLLQNRTSTFYFKRDEYQTATYMENSYTMMSDIYYTSGALFTKRRNVLPQDREKSRSREMGYSDRIALKFDRHLRSAAAEEPVKFQSDWISLNTNLSTSRLQEISR